jgi:hypothetical protein
MLSWLRLPQRRASVKALATDPDGLDAFGSEGVAVQGPGAEMPVPRNLQLLVGLLVLLVALQAYPSAVWLKSGGWRRNSGAPSSAASASSATANPAAAPASAPACEPAPAVSAAPGPSIPPTAPAVAERTSGTIPAPATSPATSSQLLAGMLKVTAPVPLRVYLKGRLVGTTEAESTMLPQGTHELEFVNEAVGFRARRTVNIRAGSTSALKLEAPQGTLHINAVPWAEVWIDGERIGETPIGNLPVRIGSREIVFRHPELGERRTTALVTLKEPVRISMDLRKK